MSRNNHPIEQEELMAYLDGELATNRAVAAAAHLEHCAECQELAADLRKLSQEMMAWEMEESRSAGIPSQLAIALGKRQKSPQRIEGVRGWNRIFTTTRLAWGSGIAVCLIFITAAFLAFSGAGSSNARQFHRMQTFAKLSPAPPATPSPMADYYSSNGALARSSTDGAIDSIARIAPGVVGGQVRSRSTSAHQESDDNLNDSEEASKVPAVPMIAKVAALTLTTKEFDKTRTSLEEILKRHNGYMGELKVTAPADSGRALTATLRIPAPQLEAALAELKKLGRVEDESQGGEEVTQQYVDLQARLANGIHTEQRLTEILRQRTGKLQDVLKVELEIDRVRGEIEQMQAEKKELSKRVAFATLNTMIKEEYFARLQGAPASTGSRFRNAAVDGYNTVVEGLISVGLFLLSAGPSLLLWAAILFFPIRWAWKKFRAAQRRDAKEEEAV